MLACICNYSHICEHVDVCAYMYAFVCLCVHVCVFTLRVCIRGLSKVLNVGSAQLRLLLEYFLLSMAGRHQYLCGLGPSYDHPCMAIYALVCVCACVRVCMCILQCMCVCLCV